METSSGDGMTPATVVLEREGIAFSLHAHDYDPGATAKGLQAANALGVPPEEVFKTLMVLVDRTRPGCVIVPAPMRLKLAAVAKLLGGKSAAMMAPVEAERMTGYQTGGISPFGQKTAVPVLLDSRALALGAIYVNAGRRGTQCRVEAATVVERFGWIVAEVAA